MFEIIDFHVHLPVEGLDHQFTEYYRRYAEKHGPVKLKLLREWSDSYDRQWREAWGFPEPDVYKRQLPGSINRRF